MFFNLRFFLMDLSLIYRNFPILKPPPPQKNIFVYGPETVRVWHLECEEKNVLWNDTTQCFLERMQKKSLLNRSLDLEGHLRKKPKTIKFKIFEKNEWSYRWAWFKAWLFISNWSLSVF